jgi:hypothetical protein
MAKIKTKSALQKMKEEEKEVYAEIGKKAVTLFNGKMSEDDFKSLLKKHELLDEVEDEDEKSDEDKTDFSAQSQSENIGMGAQNDL